VSKALFTTTTQVQYAEPGYLLFVRERTLVAQKFDAASQTLEGEPVPVGEDLSLGALGLASFSASRTGVLVFRAGETAGARLLSIDRSGREVPVMDAPAEYRDAATSPDGTRLAYDLVDASGGDIWIRDLARGVSSRFTYDPALEHNPQWSPDNRRIIFTSKAKGPGDLLIKDASGTKDAEPLIVNGEEKYVSDWSRDGRYILFVSRSPGQPWDISALPMQGEPKPFPVVKTTFSEMWATFSPDGRYIAYQSNESGRAEVYVHEFPEAVHKWQVSTQGGTEPFWREDGRELFYRAGEQIMSVPLAAGAAFNAGVPVPVIKTRFATPAVRARYRPSPDGQRFIVLSALARDAEQPASVVLNWTSALQR
jgi:dipeptidyl aminopeptidase/acylaminoacyl peptidase